MTSFPIRVAVGGDHAGFSLKSAIVEHLQGSVTRLIDCGTCDTDRCDYPDFAVAVAREIIQGRADRGILVCGSGVGVSVAANKIPGIRASICHDTYSAHQGVEHDDMNTLCIGGRIIGSELAFEIVRAFLAAKYTAGERHEIRLKKVLEIERLGLKAIERAPSLEHEIQAQDDVAI
jgi:ribose 5-phosphate isomerase B